MAYGRLMSVLLIRRKPIMNGVVVVSPHLDDAVFSAGATIAALGEVSVVTVFAGDPLPEQSTGWDRASGFSSSSEAMAARRDEDLAALDALGASAIHLGLLDNQYGGCSPEAVIESLHREIARLTPDLVIGPLGVGHPDHVTTREALLADPPPCDLWLYADLPYCTYRWRGESRTHRRLRREGHHLDVAHPRLGNSQAKLTAIGRYRSQASLFKLDRLTVPERFWHVQPRRSAPVVHRARAAG